MNANKEIWVLLEADDKKISRQSLALLEEGERLSSECNGQLHALFLGPAIEGIGREAGSRGAGKLCQFVDEGLRQYDPLFYEQVLLDLLKGRQPLLLLALSSSLGSDLLPRLAFKLNAPLVTNCAEIEVQADGELQFSKPVQQGRLFATVQCKGEGVRMATFLPERLTSREASMENDGEAELGELRKPSEAEVSPIKVTGFLKADHRTIDITEAEIIVAIGRGMGSKENLRAIESFADQIGGAIGGTRPMVDAGILPYERQIGQTGKRVSPKLIFLFGISGATEFVQGIANAGTSVAINIDSQSSILKAVDLGIVGDLNVLAPKIVQHISTAMKRA
ncbi:MAG: electron transfer flavoprotein subunit alpha/FixB family protein [Desulfuromonadaceae bacterium]